MTREEADTLSRELHWRNLVLQMTLRFVSEDSPGHSEELRIEELFDNGFYATARDSVLSVWLHFETGEGSWNAISTKRQECEPWSMTSEGEVVLSGETMDLEKLVDKFIDKLVAD